MVRLRRRRPKRLAAAAGPTTGGVRPDSMVPTGDVGTSLRCCLATVLLWFAPLANGAPEASLVEITGVPKGRQFDLVGTDREAACRLANAGEEKVSDRQGNFDRMDLPRLAPCTGGRFELPGPDAFATSTAATRADARFNRSSASAAATSANVVDIPDAGLRRAVARRLAKEPGDEITVEDMATLATLSAANGRIAASHDGSRGRIERSCGLRDLPWRKCWSRARIADEYGSRHAPLWLVSGFAAAGVLNDVR